MHIKRNLNLNTRSPNNVNVSSCIFNSWLVVFSIGLLLLSLADCYVTNFDEKNGQEYFHGASNERPCNFQLDFEDSQLSTPEIIEKYGYPVERHWITTDDGYILEVHRLPRPHVTPNKPDFKKLAPKNSSGTNEKKGMKAIKTKPAVLLMHGLFGSSRQFVINCDRRALAFQLWENGYDVWMGNYRGNSYSRNHTSLNPSTSKFWDFSIDHVGYYDVPATVDHILKTTSMKKLSVLGHSMGNGVIFGMLSNRPEYNDKVNIWFDLAGALTKQDGHASLITFMSRFKAPVNWMLKHFSRGELDGTRFLNHYLPRLCKGDGASSGVFQDICSILSRIAGCDAEQVPEEFNSVIAGGLPSSTSVKLFVQSLQLIYPGSLMFDLKPATILGKKGPYQPKPYPVENVRVPTVVMYGEADTVITVKDIQRTKEILDKSLKDPSIVEYLKIDSPTWNHLDFMFGQDADILVYAHILKRLKAVNEYNGLLNEV